MKNKKKDKLGRFAKSNRNFTNFKMDEISPWDMVKLRNTKKYQEKRKKFIEDNGGKCKICGLTEYLTISHPQQYLKIIYSKEKGKFYSSYSKLKYKEVCPRCYFDRAYEEIIKFRSEISQNYRYGKKIRRTMIKFKYRCPNCGKQYKYPKKVQTDQFKVLTELNDYQIPNTTNYGMICSHIQLKINQQQWEKYISFIDAELICRSCHYTDHFIPLTIIQNPKNNGILKIAEVERNDGN